MSARAGMAGLITRLRGMCEAGENDYTIFATTAEVYWSDGHLQGILDETRKRHEKVLLTVRPVDVNGEVIYTRYEIPWNAGVKAVEGTESGSDAFRVSDSTGATLSGYSFNDRDLSVTFAENQEGSARYWSGYSYDLRAAAKEIWLRKAGHAFSAINFSADGHKFERAAIHAHCLRMAEVYGYEGGIRTSKMVRTDLRGSNEGNKF